MGDPRCTVLKESWGHAYVSRRGRAVCKRREHSFSFPLGLRADFKLQQPSFEGSSVASSNRNRKSLDASL
jgi:hypothetical protein